MVGLPKERLASRPTRTYAAGRGEKSKNWILLRKYKENLPPEAKISQNLDFLLRKYKEDLPSEAAK